jgi:hypothetical protein
MRARTGWSHHSTRNIALALFALACTSGDQRVTYSDDGVAQNVLALIPFATTWARGLHADAVLYRIEVRSDTPSEKPPAQVLYSFYAPSDNSFMTGTSEPTLAWSGAEPQRWPASKPIPLPLPTVPMDFAAAWTLLRTTGIETVSSAVLEVNQRNAAPVVAWTVLGQLKDVREAGVYLNALSGDRMYGHTLFEPPTVDAQTERAVSAYRGALRGNATDNRGCTARSVPVPANNPVICFDVGTRQYSARSR